MDMKNSTKRSYSDNCKCCLRNVHILKDLWDITLIEGDRWVYGEMINKCFAISWQKPVDRAEKICASCINRLLNAFKFKRDVLASEQILLRQMEDEYNEWNKIADKVNIIDDNIIKEVFISDEDSEDKAVTDNLEHFEETDNVCNYIAEEEDMINEKIIKEELIPDEDSDNIAVLDHLEYFEAVIEDNTEGRKYFEVIYLEGCTSVEPVKKEKDQTNLSQQLENKIENENCKEKDLENCLKAITSNKLVPVVVLDSYYPKKSVQLKQIKTEATDVLQNQEVIRTDCSSHLTIRHAHKEEPKEKTSEFNSNTSFQKKVIYADKRDSARQTQEYSAEDLQLCLDAVKSERLTAVAASVMYNVPISTIYIILDRYKDMQNVTATSSAMKRLSPSALCGKDISSSSSPAQHKCARAANTSSRDIEEQGEQAAPKFTCDICKRDFNRKSSLYIHILGVHKYGNKNKIPISCKICNKQFSQSKSLIIHQRIHTGEKPYSCKICNKKFSRSWSLISHQRVHTGEKPYSCDMCNKKFSEKSSLSNHKRIHTGEKPYSCEVCNKNFSLLSQLTTHQRIHTGEKPYSCKVCSKKFTQLSHLIAHQRFHTGEKPYSCEICNKKFSRMSTLISHQLIHTGEKPYS